MSDYWLSLNQVRKDAGRWDELIKGWWGSGTRLLHQSLANWCNWVSRILKASRIIANQTVTHESTKCSVGKVTSAYEPSDPSGQSLSLVSIAWSDHEYFYSPLDGMLFHRRVTPRINFAGTHLYTWVEWGTVGVKWLAQGHKTMSRQASLNPDRLAH